MVPPLSSLLGADKTLLPPTTVEDQAGRPRKGPRKRKRVQSNGEFHTSSRYDTPMSAVYGDLPGQGGGAGSPRSFGQTRCAGPGSMAENTSRSMPTGIASDLAASPHGDRSNRLHCSGLTPQSVALHGASLPFWNPRHNIASTGVAPTQSSLVGGMSHSSSQGAPSSIAGIIDLC